MQTIIQSEAKVACSSFSTVNGFSEIFLTVTSRDDSSFIEALEEVKDAYISALSTHQLNRYTLQFTRVYVSDAANEYQELLKSELYELLQFGAVAVIEQRPIFGPLSILSYHIKDETDSLRKCSIVKNSGNAFQCLQTTGRYYSLLWTASCTGKGDRSYEQTENLFSEHSSILLKNAMNLRYNTVRTWIYVRDVDNNYKGMVDARRELFTNVGLINDTRYIASTGIEGRAADVKSLVMMDSLSIGNIKEEQIIRMEAPEHLSSTIVYGVTFERGLRIRFGDRSHLHISGTASIDNKGEILFPGDIRGQTIRTIDNIEALLRPHGAALEDMRYMIIYMRNRKEFQFIQDILMSRIPDSVPLITVEGAVCRPGWLIEMEGQAVIEDSCVYPPFF